MSLGIGALMGINFAGGFLQGLADSKALKREAAVYQNQAYIQRLNAARVRLRGAMNEDVLRVKNRDYLAQARAAAGEAGMGESPTFESRLATSAAALEQNVLNERYLTESEAENYLYQARVAEANAGQSRKNAGNAFRKGLISGIGSALNVLSSGQNGSYF